MKSLRLFLGKIKTRLACHSIAQQQPPAAANYQLKFTQYTIVLFFSNPRNMSKAPTKASYLQALASFGEVPPKSWGVTELKNRLLELEEEHGVVRVKGRVTTDILPGGVGSYTDDERNHRSVETACHGEDLLHEQGKPPGWSGLWSPCQFDVRGDSHVPERILCMGSQDSQGRWMQLPVEPSSTMVGACREGGHHNAQRDHVQGLHETNVTKGKSCSRQHDGNSTRSTQSQGKCSLGYLIGSHEDDGRNPEDDAANDGSNGTHQGRGGPAQGREATQEEAQHQRRQLLSSGCGTMRGSSPMTSTGPSEAGHLAATDLAQKESGSKVSENMARYFEKQSFEMVPKLFQELTQKGKTILVEVACSPESRLSAEVRRVAGHEEAAVRCSHWNGCDLGTSDGVKQTLHTIDTKDPRHVWISPECGPYSPLQAINQRTPQQIQELEEKRKKALRQYVGASCVYQHCIQKGIHVTWEWAQRCQGWRLPVIQRLIKKYDPYFGVTQGCRVGLRDPKTQNLIHKGWKMMSTCKKLTDTMNMPCLCPKGYLHARCEGGLAGLSAYYTEEFVKKVTQVLVLDVTMGMVHEEMQGKTVLPQMFGEGPVCVCCDLRDHGSEFVCGCCVSSKDETCMEHACVNHSDFSKQKEDIQRKLYLLHAATGHCSVRNMVQALERRHASKEVIDAAKEFTCSICQEKQRINTKHVASLEPLPPKFATVSADGGKWYHPKTGDECEFACIIDEGSRYRVARVLKHGKRQTMNASQFLQYFREGWMQYFGCPSTLRLDPAGAFRSHELERFCDEHSIYLDVIPGEAHWLLGTCEQAVQGLKTVMSKMAEEDPEITAEIALAEAVKVFNHREMIRGFSPIQHVLGKAPDETGRSIQSLTHNIPETPLVNPNDEFKDSVERMRHAEKALADWQAQQKVVKAMNSRGQRVMDYRPGDLVFYWRKQIAGEPAHKNGKFLGPARILATETKREPDGSLRKGSAVWCVRGRRLVKCSVEQLRPASKREELLEHLGNDEDSKVPWTFPRVVQELGGNEYEDVTTEMPTEEDWHTAQDPTQVAPPVIRHRYKRSVEDTMTGRKVDAPEGTVRQRVSGPASSSEVQDMDQAWWNMLEDPIPESTEGSVFWAQEAAAVEIEIPLPESRRGVKKMCEDLESFFVGALKRRAVEIHEKHLTDAERKQFTEAKSIEVRNFIAAKAFEALPPELQPDRSQAIGMRWLLSWKLKEDGERKAKARAILQGYQDPQYEHRATTTPVMTRQTRQFLLHEASRQQWGLRKGDVTGAFLQGREYPQTIYCTPCPEICKAMGLEPGEITKVKRGCYGLVDAPLEWYRSISEYLLEIGLVKSWADPCCWFWKPNGELKGMIAGHVDDFLFAGPKNDPEWIALEKKIQEKYKWSEWEEGSFTQCGVLIESKEDGSFHLSQPSYLEKVSEINLSSSRRKDTNAVTNDHEKTALRAVLGP